jgi:hypothetical protein
MKVAGAGAARTFQWRRTILLGITKRGDRYLRTLLIHGARAVLRHARHKCDRRSVWIGALSNRRGPNIAAVALANKNARVAWALLTRAEEFRMPATALRRDGKKHLPEVAKDVCEMMANRSDRRFLNLQGFKALRGRWRDTEKTRGFPSWPGVHGAPSRGRILSGRA